MSTHDRQVCALIVAGLDAFPRTPMEAVGDLKETLKVWKGFTRGVWDAVYKLIREICQLSGWTVQPNNIVAIWVYAKMVNAVADDGCLVDDNRFNPLFEGIFEFPDAARSVKSIYSPQCSALIIAKQLLADAPRDVIDQVRTDLYGLVDDLIRLSADPLFQTPIKSLSQ